MEIKRDNYLQQLIHYYFLLMYERLQKISRRNFNSIFRGSAVCMKSSIIGATQNISESYCWNDRDIFSEILGFLDRMLLYE